MRIWILVLVTMLVASFSAQAAEDYFPLREGCTWSYVGSANLDQAVIGPAVFHTYVGIKVAWDLGFQMGYVYFWKMHDGDILIHGTTFGSEETVYDPPRPLLDLPLTPGKVWGYSGTVSYYEGGVLLDTLPASGSWEVLGPETVTVPAGEFDTIVVQEDFVEGGPVNSWLPWRDHRHGEQSKEPTDTYLHRVALGVGWVTIPDGLELDSYSVPVAQATGSWGSIKALYGDGR